MIALIIGIIGIVLCIKAIIEILSLEGDIAKKLIAAIIVFATNWIGLAVYYFFAKDKLAEWLK